jgi:DNA-binding NtrC family response regulator
MPTEDEDGRAGQDPRSLPDARVPRILLVDDEPSVRLGVRRFLVARGFDVVEAGGCAEAERAAVQGVPDAAIMDYQLPDGDGIELLRRLKETAPGLLGIILTGHGSIELAVRAVKEGADQFLTKPVDLAAVLVLLERMIEDRRNRQKLSARGPRAGDDAIDPFLGRSPAMRHLEAEARRLATSDGAVLILGETGTGKGVLARWLHENGPRRQEALVDLNCAALSGELLASELFGHEPGAFTGANRRKPGLFEVANRGTVFLDEIGDMDLGIQARVLKVIEEKRFRRLGDVRDHQVDVRLIAATHRDIRRLIQERAFREDLYYRISAFPLRIAPLRERREDVPLLARGIVDRLASRRSHSSISISPEALEELGAYDWPGNIRELRNVLERALLVCEGAIRPGDFQFGGRLGAPAPRAEPLTLEEVERRHIEEVLRLESGHVARTARRLGVSTSSLYDRLRKFGLARRP